MRAHIDARQAPVSHVAERTRWIRYSRFLTLAVCCLMILCFASGLLSGSSSVFVNRSPKMVLSDESLILSHQAPGELVEGVFIIRNVGTEPLEYQLIPSCGCVTLTPIRGQIASLKDQAIRVGINTSVYGQEKSILIGITLNDQSMLETDYRVVSFCPSPLDTTPKIVVLRRIPPAGGMTALFGRGIADARPASARIDSNSIASKTVQVARRTKSIEDVRVGDFVMAMDEKTGRIEPRRVLETYKRVSNHLRVLKIRSSDGIEQQIKTTDEHPFRVVGKGWVIGSKLHLGSHIQRSDGDSAVLIDTQRINIPQGITVFNFQLEYSHNYYVSSTNSEYFTLVYHAGIGYRVMSSQEYAAARYGRHSDSIIARNDPNEMGIKWLRAKEDSEKRWKEYLSIHESDILMTQIPSKNPIESYPKYNHPPQGTAVTVPIEDLGPATLIPD